MNLFGANDEEDIVKRLRNGENRAMRDFYNSYAGFLSAVCTRYIGNDDDVKDVLQDSFISIITHIETFKFQGKGSLKAWATRIVVNKSLMYLRDKKKTQQIISKDDIPDNYDNDDLNVEHIPPDIVQNMVKELPDGYRTVFNLYVFEEMSHKEIAVKLGIKEASSASQLHRAKHILAKRIREYNNNKYQQT